MSIEKGTRHCLVPFSVQNYEFKCSIAALTPEPISNL